MQLISKHDFQISTQVSDIIIPNSHYQVHTTSELSYKEVLGLLCNSLHFISGHLQNKLIFIYLTCHTR